MSISDINKTMALYAQPTEFDQNAWKSAFDIANAFANSSEKQRANRENIATSPNRINFMNWDFANKQQEGDLRIKELQRLYNNALATDPSQNDATIASNNWIKTNAETGTKGIKGQDEMVKSLMPYFVKADGSFATLPEAYAAAKANGVNLSAYAFSPIWQAGNQEQANKQALLQSVLNHSMETTTDALGNIVQTGNINQPLLKQRLAQEVAMGRLTKEEADGLSARLFPISPTQAVLPLGIGAGNFSNQLANIQSRLNTANAIVPYAAGEQPINVKNIPQAQPIASSASMPGMVMNGRYLGTNKQAEQQDINSLLQWIDIEKARQRGPHW